MVKNQKEAETIKKSGQIAAFALLKTLEKVRPGVTTLELDRIAEKEIVKLGAKSSFKTVKGYNYTICATVEDQVVHTPPSERILLEGEIIGIDLGVYFEGFHTDMARTVGVGRISEEKKNFIKSGFNAWCKAFEKVKIGGRIGDISGAIQSSIEKDGYHVVRELTGHGVGRALHEEPSIPCFGKAGQGEKILEGMTLAIEVIYTQGKPDLVFNRSDGWTIRTCDGKLGGLYEDTVLVTKSDPIALTMSV
jgi:methionyl aminopeptidase